MNLIHSRPLKEEVPFASYALFDLYIMSQKNCAKLFLSVLCQTCTNFDTFWQKDGKEATII